MMEHNEHLKEKEGLERMRIKPKIMWARPLPLSITLNVSCLILQNRYVFVFFHFCVVFFHFFFKFKHGEESKEKETQEAYHSKNLGFLFIINVF